MNEDSHLEAQYEDRFLTEADFGFSEFHDEDEDGEDYPDEPFDDFDGPYHFIMPGTENW